MIKSDAHRTGMAIKIVLSILGKSYCTDCNSFPDGHECVLELDEAGELSVVMSPPDRPDDAAEYNYSIALSRIWYEIERLKTEYLALHKICLSLTIQDVHIDMEKGAVLLTIHVLDYSITAVMYCVQSHEGFAAVLAGDLLHKTGYQLLIRRVGDDFFLFQKPLDAGEEPLQPIALPKNPQATLAQLSMPKPTEAMIAAAKRTRREHRRRKKRHKKDQAPPPEPVAEPVAIEPTVQKTECKLDIAKLGLQAPVIAVASTGPVIVTPILGAISVDFLCMPLMLSMLYYMLYRRLLNTDNLSTSDKLDLYTFISNNARRQLSNEPLVERPTWIRNLQLG